MLEDWIKLNDIHIEFLRYEVPLPEIKELYFRAKKIFIDRRPYLDRKDLGILLDIFVKGFEGVSEFWRKWRENRLSPTDGELDLLEEAFEEWAQTFNELSKDYPHVFSPENNQIRQRNILKSKQIVAEEKRKRREPDKPNNPNPNQPSQKNVSNNLFTKQNVFFFF